MLYFFNKIISSKLDVNTSRVGNCQIAMSLVGHIVGNVRKNSRNYELRASRVDTLSR